MTASPPTTPPGEQTPLVDENHPPAEPPHANRAFRDNRLAHETSPYLLQHKTNPVDWWPWGPQALAEARRTGKPILLSVGYAACHWCHVMAHESFEDPATAAVMNDLFVNIKVDREERPDIDHIYMSALHLLGQQGGWPLTMILTPEGEPVWGGTYFPNVSRYGRPAFVDVLREIARLFREEPHRVEHNRNLLITRLAEKSPTESEAVLGLSQLDGIAKQLAGAIDTLHGGLRGAPKFPQCTMLEFLWRAGRRAAVLSTPVPSHRNDATVSRQSPDSDDGANLPHRSNVYFDLFDLSLERMCEGGIYDHLGGGFSRYSVDERWLVPHFEKMLYDNAQLLELLALAYARTGHSLFRTRAIETIGWLEREMLTAGGAFASSLDADSEGEEGKFYVWSLGEIERLLSSDEAIAFAASYDVTAAGNFEGHNILNRLGDLDSHARRRSGQPFALHQSSPATEQRLAALRQTLHSARNARVHPARDDKVLADWNGLMIAALANSALLLDQPSCLELARGAFDFIARHMTRGGRLGHSWRADQLVFPGFASDFAAMIRAALALFEATAEQPYLDRAVAWQHALDRHYANPANAGYFLTADDAEGLIVRPDVTHDDALPNANGIAAQNLVRLAVLTGEDLWRRRADLLFDRLVPRAAGNLFGHLSLLNALDLRLRAAEIIIVREGPHIDPLIVAVHKLPFTDRIVLHAKSRDTLPPDHSAHEKFATAPDGAVFVCVGQTCSLPITDPAAITQAVLDLTASVPGPSSA